MMPATLPLPMINGLLCRAERLLQRVEPQLGGFGDVISERRQRMVAQLAAHSRPDGSATATPDEILRWVAQTLLSLAGAIEALTYTGDKAMAATASALTAEVLALYVVLAGPLRVRCRACGQSFSVDSMPMRCQRCRG